VLRAAIYLRVSTQEQKTHGISVDAQKEDCCAWVKESGHKIVGIYNDAGLSARARYTKRAAMIQLLEDVQNDKIDLIVFTKLDRWFRNVADYYEVQSVLEKHGVKWRAIQEDYETETASGRFKVNIMLAVAQDEADRTSERIKTVNDFKRKKGEAVGRPALGYKIEDKKWVKDPETEPAIKAFFAAYQETYSINDAMQAAGAYGVKLNATHAGRILRNPTYYGNAFGIKCPPYITKEQFDARQERAKIRTRKNKSGRTYIFSGLLKCGFCGGAMTCGYQPKGDIKYYRCVAHTQKAKDCPGSYVNERKLEKYLILNLGTIVERSKATLEKKTPVNNTKKIQALNSRLERLKDLYIDGEITRESYNKKSSSIKTQIKELQKTETSQKVPEIPSNWVEIYNSLDDTHKKIFWKKLLRSIIIYNDAEPSLIF